MKEEILEKVALWWYEFIENMCLDGIKKDDKEIIYQYLLKEVKKEYFATNFSMRLVFDTEKGLISEIFSFIRLVLGEKKWKKNMDSFPIVDGIPVINYSSKSYQKVTMEIIKSIIDADKSPIIDLIISDGISSEIFK